MNTFLYRAACLWMIVGTQAFAGEPDNLATAKAVPRMQIVPLPDHQSSFQLEGRELTAAHFAPTARRPFWFPVRASHAASLTRMGHPHDPLTHSHHNSVWISHADVDGINYWGDHGKNLGQIRTVTIPREAYTDGDDSAAMIMVNHWRRDEDDSVQLIETRRAEVLPLDGPQSWLMVIDLQFTTPKGVVTTFRPSAFGLVAVRMAKSIGVHDGGGRILNSAGGINEQECFRKPAKWCDYSGRLSNDRDGFAGIALMNHPANPQHPTPFHVRDDGWMGACLNLEDSVVVSDAQTLRLRYGLWVHTGVPSAERCDAVWQQFSERAMADLTLKR